MKIGRFSFITLSPEIWIHALRFETGIEAWCFWCSSWGARLSKGENLNNILKTWALGTHSFQTGLLCGCWNHGRKRKYLHWKIMICWQKFFCVESILIGYSYSRIFEVIQFLYIKICFEKKSWCPPETVTACSTTTFSPFSPRGILFTAAISAWRQRHNLSFLRDNATWPKGKPNSKRHWERQISKMFSPITTRRRIMISGPVTAASSALVMLGSNLQDRRLLTAKNDLLYLDMSSSFRGTVITYSPSM